MHSRQIYIVHIFFILAGFFASAEGIWTDAASGFFKNILGIGYIFVQEQALILLGCFFILATLGFRGKKEFLFVCLAFLSIGFFEYIVSFFFEMELYGFRQFLFGFLFPVILLLALITSNCQKIYFKYYYIGYIVFISTALIILLFFDKNFSIISRGHLSDIVLSVRSYYRDSLFFLVVGNANKQSNYLVMSILMAPYLLELKPTHSKLYSVFTILATILLFLLCSRATLILLPIALYVNRIYFIPMTKRVKTLLWLSLAIFSIVHFNELTTIFKYVIFNIRFDYDEKDFLGTFHSRLVQWEQLKALLEDPTIFIHGIGVGNYGLKILRGSVEQGTHNLFLDHFVASGLYGVIMLIVILSVGLAKSFILKDKRLIFAYVFFICLAFREYSFAYVYVTSMGGLIFVFMLYLTFNWSSNYKRQTAKTTDFISVNSNLGLVR